MKFSNLFFKDEEPKEEVKETKETPQQQQQQKAPVFTTNFTASPLPTTSGVPDDKFVSMLESVIAENNISGLDYFEFKMALDKMKNLPIDEATKFLTAYASFEVQGCNKLTLTDAIDKYIGLIKVEEQNFDNEMKVSFKENVDEKKVMAERAQQEITELNAKIVELNTFILSTTQAAQQEEMKLRMADANFKQSVQKVISIMETDKEKINKYIN